MLCAKHWVEYLSKQKTNLNLGPQKTYCNKRKKGVLLIQHAVFSVRNPKVMTEHPQNCYLNQDTKDK